MAAPTEKKINFIETVSTAVQSTQQLRVSVGHVFEQLNDGMKPTEDADGKQKKFIAGFHQRLLTVVKHFTDLEKLAASLPQQVSTPGLGNTSLLTLDSITDKTPTYQHLLQAYKWSTKSRDHATLAYCALQPQHSLKRSQNLALQNAKRPRKLQGTSHSASSQHVDNLIQSMIKLFPDMNIKLTRPIGSPAVLQITLGMTLRAIVVLRGLVIEWVSIKGFDEEFATEDGKLDIWGKSKHAVFQKVTDHTHAAMLHYYSPVISEIAFGSFLKWLHSYGGLFSSPCHRCGKYLRDNLPPTWRHTITYDGYHESCRP